MTARRHRRVGRGFRGLVRMVVFFAYGAEWPPRMGVSVLSSNDRHPLGTRKGPLLLPAVRDLCPGGGRADTSGVQGRVARSVGRVVLCSFAGVRVAMPSMCAFSLVRVSSFGGLFVSLKWLVR